MNTTEKWEVRIDAGRFAIPYCKGGAEQIERGSEGIDDGAHASIDYGWKWALFAKYRDFLAGLRIEIPDLYSRVRLLPNVKLVGEEWELGFSPLESGVSVYEIPSHGIRS